MAAPAPASGEKQRKVGTYILEETLGKGGYSWVKKGRDEKTGHSVALKFMTRAEKQWEREQAEQVRTEIKSLIRVNHDHVMKLYAYNLNCKYPEKSGKFLNTILLVLEYCPGGELFDILYYTQHLDKKTARTYFLQMIQGIKACHDNGIVHRDIKPQNLLMDANYQLKITDFGLSFLCKDEASADAAIMKTSYVGTRGYQAPELLNRQAYTKKCDMFSAGVVLFILLTGYPPFEQASKTDKWYQPLTEKDKKTGGPNTSKFWKQHDGCQVDPVCQDLISGMLAYRPKDRLSIDEIIKHKWCTKEVHTPKSLAKVLRERHKETRRRRRNDKKKASEMQNSVKRKKRAIGGESDDPLFKEIKDGPITKGEGCPEVELDRFPQTFTTFYCKKEDLGPAYERAVNVYSLAFDNKDCTQVSKNNPWQIVTTLKDPNHAYTIQTRIVKLEDKDVYAFEFKRITGPPLGYRKIWTSMEDMLLATPEKGKNPFWDNIECTDEDEAEEEEKEQEEEAKEEEAPAKEAEAPAAKEEAEAAKEEDTEAAAKKEE